jgi:hypothetical protein
MSQLLTFSFFFLASKSLTDLCSLYFFCSFLYSTGVLFRVLNEFRLFMRRMIITSATVFRLELIDLFTKSNGQERLKID